MKGEGFMQEEKEIKFKTTINKEDYRSMVYFNVFAKTKIRAILFVLISLIVITELVLNFLGIYKIEGFYLYFDYFAVAVLVLLPIEVELICRKMIKTDKCSLGIEKEITINNEGITCIDQNSNSKFEWPLMYRAYESNKYFLIFINAQQAFIIPKRDLKENEIKELRTIINKKLLSKNKLKKK